MSNVAVTMEHYVSAVADMSFLTGTWTDVHNAGLSYKSKSAADTTSTIVIPFNYPRRSDIGGIKIQSLELLYRCATDDLDAALDGDIYKQSLIAVAGATVDLTTAALTTTNDGVVTADDNDRLFTITVTTPAWDFSSSTDYGYEALLTMNAGATSAIRVYGAKWNFEALT